MKKMREKERINRIAEKIAEVWTKHPDQRLFQILFNYGFYPRAEKLGTVQDPFNLEDDIVEAHLDKILSGEVEM